MYGIMKKFIRDEQGLETVEYAIITGLIVAATITLIANIGTWVEGTFEELDTTLSTEAPVTTTGG